MGDAASAGMPVVTQLPINFDDQPAAVSSPLSQLKRHSLSCSARRDSVDSLPRAGERVIG